MGVDGIGIARYSHLRLFRERARKRANEASQPPTCRSTNTGTYPAAGVNAAPSSKKRVPEPSGDRGR